MQNGKIYLCSISNINAIPENTVRLLIARKPIKNMAKYKLNHEIKLAPSQELWLDYSVRKIISWEEYVIRFKKEMENMYTTFKKIENRIRDGYNVALICYCKESSNCHRGLIGEYFKHLGIAVLELGG